VANQSHLAEVYASFDRGIDKALDEIGHSFAKSSAGVQRSDATRFILEWMGEHYRAHKRFDRKIGRRLAPSSADQFTGAVAAVVSKFLEATGSDLIVKSEVAVERKRGAIRPDISIWDQSGRLRSVIECKTNLGYNRSGWEDQYRERTRRLKLIGESITSFLLILSSENWNPESYLKSPVRRKHWFCLSNIWPTELVSPFDGQIIDPLEPMLETISGVAPE
jgi:hypothetical protein